MDATKGSALAAPIYEDFVPTSELVSDEDCDTLLIHLNGFKKEQLRVQLTKGILRISGSMPIGNNKMRRFQKQFQVSPNCDTNKITAKFESSILHVKQPKLITPSTPSAKPEQHKLPPPPPPQQQQPTPTRESEKPANELQATQKAPEKANGNKEGGETEGKKTSSSQTEKNMETLTRNGEKTEARITRTDNYRKMVVAMGERLKMQRRVVKIVLAAIFTCIVAIYVNNLFTSFREPKN